MASELVRQLIDTGIHFGHRASRWNPKMKPYIFGKRSAIHIIDIRETVRGLLRAKKFISMVVARGGDVLFVGTKRQARQHIRQKAMQVSMPFVAERWLGGTLTNFATIRSRVKRLEQLEAEEADGTAREYSKKMIASRARELRKIKRNLEGIRSMTRQPVALVVIDVHRERNAVREARKLGIPTVCLIDTDSDPDFADLPIPGNDDAMRAIELVLTHLADAVEQGLKGRKAPEPLEQPQAPTQPVEQTGTARLRRASPESSATATLMPPTPQPMEGIQGTNQPDPKDAAKTGLTPAAAAEHDSAS